MKYNLDDILYICESVHTDEFETDGMIYNDCRSYFKIGANVQITERKNDCEFYNKEYKLYYIKSIELPVGLAYSNHYRKHLLRINNKMPDNYEFKNWIHESCLTKIKS